MKPIKQIYKDLLAFWEEKFIDRKFRTGVICIIITIVLFALTWCFALTVPSSAEEPTPLAETAPNDLAGYTVTVPSGWSSTAGFGRFALEGELTSEEFGTTDSFSFMWIGYYNDFGDFLPSADTLQLSGYTLTDNSYGFTLDITGGNNSTYSSLIQWFVDNNAIFTLTIPDEPDEPDEPEGLTIPAGIYYLQNVYNDTRGTLTFDKPFISGDSLYYNSIEFEGYQDNQYTEVIYTYTQVIPDGSSGPPAPPFELSVYNGVDGFENIANCIILIQVDEILTEEESSLFNQVFIPVTSDNKLINLYNGALENGKNFGYNTGYDSGFLEGFDAGVENSGGNFFGNFIESILNALDKLVILPGNISILDVIKAVCGVFVVVWLLKLLAGG